MIDVGISWDDTEGEDEVQELGRMTVSELKERLRSIGQKVREACAIFQSLAIVGVLILECWKAAALY